MPNVVPYNFVPLGNLDKGKKQVKIVNPYRGAGSDGSPRLSGYMHCRLTTVTPLFIPNTTGDRHYKEVKCEGKTRRTRVFYSRETLNQIPDASNLPETPIIPGSSIRGVLRSVFEAASNSCLRVSSNAVPDNYKPCTGGKRDNITLRDICPACSLFGMILVKNKQDNDENPIKNIRSYAGRLRFRDAYALENTEVKYEPYRIPGQYKPREFMCIDKTGRQIKGRKFYWHHMPKPKYDWVGDTIYAIKPGAVFCFDIYFDCLKEEELMQLAAVVGLKGDDERRYCHKLGAVKPLGFGSVQMEVNKIIVRELGIDGTGILYINNEVTDKYKNVTMQGAFGSEDNHLDDLMNILRYKAIDGLNVAYPPTKAGGYNKGNGEPFIKGSIQEVVKEAEKLRTKKQCL